MFSADSIGLFVPFFLFANVLWLFLNLGYKETLWMAFTWFLWSWTMAKSDFTLSMLVLKPDEDACDHLHLPSITTDHQVWRDVTNQVLSRL